MDMFTINFSTKLILVLSTRLGYFQIACVSLIGPFNALLRPASDFLLVFTFVGFGWLLLLYIMDVDVDVADGEGEAICCFRRGCCGGGDALP